MIARIIVLIALMLLPAPSILAEPQRADQAKEIAQTVAEWGRQQTADYIKSIFKPKQDEQAELNRVSFGAMIIQVGYLMAYGWLVAFMMPDKIAGLMRSTAIMGSIQVVVEYVYMLA